MNQKMKLLDLYCGAGGCSVGYKRAGFDVVGVDLHPQPRYPFKFFQADALEYLRENWMHFDVIHASPPCQAHTAINHAKKGRIASLVDGTRAELNRIGLPYVLENVPGAPMRNAIMLCGTMFGLDVIRHRLFDSNQILHAPLQGCQHRGSVSDGTYVSVHGGGQRSTHAIPYSEQRKRWEEAMGIEWMGTRRELVNAIPPAYTEYIGHQLMALLEMQYERAGGFWVPA